jgi:hypothetical protein
MEVSDWLAFRECLQQLMQNSVAVICPNNYVTIRSYQLRQEPLLEFKNEPKEVGRGTAGGGPPFVTKDCFINLQQTNMM